MKRSTNAKFPSSAQLFRFCQRVLVDRRQSKVHDQEIGAILSFNPSDCSHWKRGEKNIKSIFALEKLSASLGVENTLILDIASGHMSLDEAFFEYKECRRIQRVFAAAQTIEPAALLEIKRRTQKFVNQIHAECDFKTAPLYLPEVIQNFSFIKTQPAEMMDKLSRVLRVRSGQYCIQFAKGELKPQTRQSISMDLARIFFEGERARFPELGTVDKDLVALEEYLFVCMLLVPEDLVMEELLRLDNRRNVIQDLANIFWVPKSLICLQVQQVIQS